MTAGFDFDGYDEATIPLEVASTKFEPWPDALAWMFHTAVAVTGSFFGRKALFPWHSDERPFHYVRPGPTREKPVKLALFSDFGTGLAHSRYIAKHLTRDATDYDCAIHLGDVYYAGRAREFDDYFIRPLQGLVEKTSLFTLAGNHEMYSNGHAFYRYLHGRRAANPALQVQEGSYFSLEYGEHLQLIGIETEYFEGSRYQEPKLRAWLERALRAGRDAGRVNVLLSGNEPYTYGKPNTTKLADDLRSMLPLVDLWFWGNDHYCAVFDKSESFPVASCIGHGGHPYELAKYGLDETMSQASQTPVPVAWAESSPRYPKATGLRPTLGNHGYCELTVSADGTLELVYKDWMRRERWRTVLRRGPSGRLELAG